MDEKTIKAMWAVIEALDEKAADIHRRGLDGLYFVDTTIPKAKFLAGIEGIRSLVDAAAAEQAEPVAAEGDEDEKLMRDLCYALNQVTREAEKNGDEHVLFKAKYYSYAMFTHNARATVRAIEAMLDARPTTAASEDGPTIEECLAAVNRAEYMGGGFKIAAVNEQAGTWISSLGIEGVGRLLIAREKAAKGGAH